VGRVERRGYDRDGNLTSQAVEAPEGTVHLARTTTFDGIDRPRLVTETVEGPLGEVTYRQETRYDDSSHVVYASDRRGFVTRRALDDLDRVFLEVVDDAGGPIARPSGAPPALALSTRFGYDAAGNRNRVTDPLGRVTSEIYDVLGRLTRRDLPMGVWESFTYDGERHVVERSDRRAIVRRASYDLAGRATVERLVESISNGGRELATLTLAYGDVAGAGGIVTVTESDALGHATTRYQDALHREVQTADAAGNSAFTAYDAAVRRAAKDRKGYVTEYDHDAVNRPVAQRDRDLAGAVRYTQSTVHDDAARAETSTDRNGIPTKREKDGLGRVGRVTRGSGAEVQVTETSQDGNGNVTRVVDPNVHATAAVFDGASRKTSETKADGTAVAATWTYRYDAAGNRLETKGPRGIWPYDLRETYDDLDRPVRSEDGLGNVTTRAFDGLGNKVCEKRPLGGSPLVHGGAAGLTAVALAAAVCAGPYVTAFAYDEESKLLSVTDAQGGVSSFVYDRVRNLLAKQDARGSLTTYRYDVLNRRRGEYQHLDQHPRLTASDREQVPLDEGTADPVAGTGTLAWVHDYDANGNPAKTQDPRTLDPSFGVVSSYGVLDRLTSQTFTNHPFPRELPSIDSIGWEYDGNGNPRTVTERKLSASGMVSEVTSFTYDGLDRPKTETRYDGKVLTYGYDLKGNRTSVTDPDQVATTYTYDAQDRLSTATTPEGTATYRYWPDGLLKGVTLPSGNGEGRCYDPAGRLGDIVTARGAVPESCAVPLQVLSRYQYQYDPDGNRLVQVEARTDPATQTFGALEETRYGYDALDRLSGVSYPDDRAVLYRLDAVGNRTGEREAPAELVTDLTAYDAVPAASLTRDVTAAFNRADWLLSRTDAKDAAKNAAFGYDLNGNLVSKQQAGSTRTLRWDARDTLTAVYDAGAEVGRYDYDRDLQRVKRRTASENVEYVLDDKFVLQEASGAAGHAAYRRYHYAKQPLSVSDSGQGTRFLSNDALGSVSDLTTTSGTLYSKRQYDAWGQHRNNTAPAANQPKLGFTGHQFDPETGLVYARARYYDTEIGRFVSRDSYEGEIGDAPSLHRYAYAAANPLRFTDTNGHVYDDLLPEERKQIQQANQKRRAEQESQCSGGNAAACEQISDENMQAAIFVGPAAVVSGVALVAAAGMALPAAATELLPGAGTAAKPWLAAIAAFFARNGQRVADWVYTAAGCVDSQSLVGCAVSVATHGSYEYAYRGGTVPRAPRGEQAVVEAPSAPSTARVVEGPQQAPRPARSTRALAPAPKGQDGEAVASVGGEARLPREGRWTGEPGNSDFIPNRASRLPHPDDPTVVDLPPGAGVPFSNGRPDFTRQAVDEFSVPGLDGSARDRTRMALAVAERYGLVGAQGRPTAAAGLQYMEALGLVPHHAGGTNVQLVPQGLHGSSAGRIGVPHVGGAAELRRANDTGG